MADIKLIEGVTKKILTAGDGKEKPE